MQCFHTLCHPRDRMLVQPSVKYILKIMYFSIFPLFLIVLLVEIRQATLNSNN